MTRVKPGEGDPLLGAQVFRQGEYLAEQLDGRFFTNALDAQQKLVLAVHEIIGLDQLLRTFFQRIDLGV